MIEIALKDYLVTKGTAAAGRIVPPDLLHTVDFPAITYQIVSERGHHDINVDFPRVNFTAWAPSYMAARTLAMEVEEHLRRFKGIISGHRIKQIVMEPGPGVLHDREGYDKGTGKTGLFYVPQDFKVIYERND